MNLGIIGVLAGTAAMSWWLSGYDAKVTGHDLAADFRRRAIRTGATLLLMAAGLAIGGPIFIATAVFIAVIWAGCLSDLCARGFHKLVDPEDSRQSDPKQTTRDLDKLAELVQDGRNDEAVELCRNLMESGEASALAIEHFHQRFDLFGQARVGPGSSLF